MKKTRRMKNRYLDRKERDQLRREKENGLKRENIMKKTRLRGLKYQKYNNGLDKYDKIRTLVGYTIVGS